VLVPALNTLDQLLIDISICHPRLFQLLFLLRNIIYIASITATALSRQL
jgi:hypothetical protein